MDGLNETAQVSYRSGQGRRRPKRRKDPANAFFEQPLLLTRRGRFLLLDGPAGKVYTGSVKGCADGPRPRITDGTS